MDRREYLKVAAGGGAVSVAGYGLYTSMFRDRERDENEDESGTQPSDGQTGQEGADGDGSENGTVEEDFEAEPRDGWKILGVVPPSRELTVLDPFEEWLGKQHAVVGLFLNMGHPEAEIERLVRGVLGSVWDRGHIPQLYWQPFLPNREETSNEINAEIADGEWDDEIHAWANSLADWAHVDGGPDRRVYLNLAPEFNGDWSPWSPALGNDDEDDFVEMWRHIHDIHTDAGLGSEHVQWIWTLDNTTRDVDREACYPGDEYVDWSGIHAYNWANWGSWNDPVGVYGSTLNFTRTINDKPVAITEFGSSSEQDDGEHDPERKNEWLEEAYEFLREEDVRMSLYFNLSKETDWAVFDSEYGTETVEIDGQSYNAYPAYREAVSDDGILGTYPEHPRILTDEEFAGEF